MSIGNFRSNETLAGVLNARHFVSNERKIVPFRLFNVPNPQEVSKVQWKLKRIFDFVSALLGLIILSPLLALISLLIKLDSKGPVLFTQKRVGFKGQLFEMYKFRSMCLDAEDLLDDLKDKNESNDVMFKISNDPRVTKIGSFIRKYSLDELPQLLNVLKGEMSIVGPRPPLVSEIKSYKEWHHSKFETLPGLTGMWQVNGREKIQSFDRVIELDLYYIRNWSLLLDFKLIFKTIPVVLFGKAC